MTVDEVELTRQPVPRYTRGYRGEYHYNEGKVAVIVR